MRCFYPFPGGHSGVVPPDPIPNSEVKRACADGSVALPCKSRSPPGALSKEGLPIRGGLCLCGGCSRDRRSTAPTAHRFGLHPGIPLNGSVGALSGICLWWWPGESQQHWIGKSYRERPRVIRSMPAKRRWTDCRDAGSHSRKFLRGSLESTDSPHHEHE